MSEKIKLDEKQQATLANALTLAAQALYHYADVAETFGDPVASAALRNQAEDMEFLLGFASQVERITVRLHDSTDVSFDPEGLRVV